MRRQRLRHSSQQANEHWRISTALRMMLWTSWLDGREPQPTTEIVALYERSQAIETKITNTLAQMDQAAAKMAEISKLVKAVQMNSVSLCFTRIWRSYLTFVGRRTCILFPTSK